VSAFLFVTPTWDGAAWGKSMQAARPAMPVRVWPDTGAVGDIHYAAAWLPPVGVVASLPHLKVIFSLGAGVDAILSDGSLPASIPIVRVNDPDLTNRMSEHVVMHVLMHHRQQLRINENQRRKVWDSFAQHAACDLRVGVMGLGVLGQDAARKLSLMGFDVAGWSRSAKTIAGIQCFSGKSELPAFLARTDVLVCLLPATPETDGILDMVLFRSLSRSGPLGAPVLINAGRGRQQVESDVLRALDDGILQGASLDVFAKEPLPVDSPFWQHSKVMISPHIAADSDPATICRYIAKQIERYERDGVLENLVDRARGY
jgi:glyoxylate/hydroxypyruvate reductase